MSTVLDNPYGIPLAMDYPQSPARWDVPLWSENYIFQGGDPEKGIFFYHLIGRMSGNPDHWRSVFQCTLPDGEILSWKSYGRDLDPQGPSTGALTAHCVEPHRRWRVRYDGVAARTTREQNRSEFLPFRSQPEPVEFDVMWDATTPMWSIGGETAAEAEKHTIWNMHLEQAGVVRGHIKYRGELITLEGSGFRDHSVGPRNFAPGSSHTWLQANFPDSNRHFGLISIAFGEDDGDRHSNAFCWSNGKLQDCTFPSFPIWPAGDRLYEHESFSAAVDIPGCEPVKFVGHLLEPSFYFVVDAPSEIVLGYGSELDEPVWAVREVLCQYDLDGEVGYGFLEISRRV